MREDLRRLGELPFLKEHRAQVDPHGAVRGVHRQARSHVRLRPDKIIQTGIICYEELVQLLGFGTLVHHRQQQRERLLRLFAAEKLLSLLARAVDRHHGLGILEFALLAGWHGCRTGQVPERLQFRDRLGVQGHGSRPDSREATLHGIKLRVEIRENPGFPGRQVCRLGGIAHAIIQFGHGALDVFPLSRREAVQGGPTRGC